MTELQHAPNPATAQTQTGLHVYNTMSRRKEPFETIEPNVVRMYVCGVTVYDHAHIGHGMSAITFDVIRRYLEHLGYSVRHAQNFTDIDDKIINRANQEGISPDDLTERLIAAWMEEVQALHTLPATVYPKATEEVDEIIHMIRGLIEGDHAYAVDGDVYFRVRSFSDYGKLSRRDPDDLRSGSRIEVDERKDDPLDFALWKAAKSGEPSWPSPWGDGRPGWHIECSAMCTHYLGGTVDIHGGGTDLIFPHHENEIAQSEAFLGHGPFSRFWIHNGMLRIEGEKMSKSLGNIVKLSSVIERGLVDAFRLVVLQSHYRAPLNYTEEGLQAANTGLQRLRSAAREVPTSPKVSGDMLLMADLNLAAEKFHNSMLDDFDTPGAMAALFELARTINRTDPAGNNAETAQARDGLWDLGLLLGLELRSEAQQLSSSEDTDSLIRILIDLRARLRAERQFELADLVRVQLQEAGYTLEDTKSGTEWKRS
ncbi:MAG: cysteine--tRNA ligase [Chloroflexota bacterium]|jgi:cysteinyl-tRNA synthetase|nr:cysteine--tRNA ligase [Chloroflexota bacterium]